MEDLRTLRQKDLERLRNEQREDLGALRSAGVKPFLVGALEGVADPELAELAIRREAKSRRTGAVAQSLGGVFAHLDSRAALAVARWLRGATPATQAIVDDLERDLDETDPPLLDAYLLGPYVVLIEAAELLVTDVPSPPAEPPTETPTETPIP